MYKNLDRKQDVGHFFTLIDIDAFLDVPQFKRRIDDMIDRIKSCRKRQGASEILVPGERSSRIAAENEKVGVPMDAATLAELGQLCLDLGVEFELQPAQQPQPVSTSRSSVR
jgi:LDH2 family malate/lactate/ureidoglycolate dehydrogenase